MTTFFPLSWNAETQQLNTTEFNSADFNYGYGYIQKGDLLSYANLFKINIFTNINYFNDLFSQSINGVTSEVFDYLKNITSDVGTFMNSVNSKLLYIRTNSTTTIIDNDLISDRITCNNNINSSKIISFNGIYTNLLSKNINCSTLKCDQIIIKNNDQVIKCFIHVNNRSLPVKNNFNINSSFSYSLNSSCTINILDSDDKILYSYHNFENDFYHSGTIDIANMVKINLIQL